MSAVVKQNVASKEMSLSHFTDSQREDIKNIICRGATDDEAKVFLHICEHTRLNPFLKQIYLVPRWDSNLKKNVYTTQVSIDGARLVAERTGNYCPGRETTYTYDNEGKLISATAYVKKLTKDGTWHEISATAFWEEYVQTTKDGTPTHMWNTKRHVMLGKCAEAIVLRKAFPNDLSGVVVEEEMQKDIVDVKPLDSLRMEAGQIMQISKLLEGCDDYRQKLLGHYGVDNIAQLPGKDFEMIMKSINRYLSSVESVEEASQ